MSCIEKKLAGFNIWTGSTIIINTTSIISTGTGRHVEVASSTDIGGHHTDVAITKIIIGTTTDIGIG